MSKACVNALMAIPAQENERLVINGYCPSWVDTDIVV